MAQFSVNAQRFDPYKNFKFRVKWDGRYVAGVSKVGAPQAHHRGGRAPRGRRPVDVAQVARAAPKYEAITLERGVTHDTEFEQWANKVWNFGAGLGRGGLAQGLPQGHHHRGLQRGRPARDRLQGVPLLGVGVPGAARPRRQRQRRRHPDHQARERGLGARLRRHRAGRADVHRAGRCPTALPTRRHDRGDDLLDLWERAARLAPVERALLWRPRGSARPRRRRSASRRAAISESELRRQPVGRTHGLLLALRERLLRPSARRASPACPAGAARVELSVADPDLLSPQAGPQRVGGGARAVRDRLRSPTARRPDRDGRCREARSTDRPRRPLPARSTHGRRRAGGAGAPRRRGGGDGRRPARRRRPARGGRGARVLPRLRADFEVARSTRRCCSGPRSSGGPPAAARRRRARRAPTAGPSPTCSRLGARAPRGVPVAGAGRCAVTPLLARLALRADGAVRPARPCWPHRRVPARFEARRPR